jgi:hypothetical protein
MPSKSHETIPLIIPCLYTIFKSNLMITKKLLNGLGINNGYIFLKEP